uniref:Major facilitator superfamily (MFS) profile domain-containing protein n=1 Tax=Mucochytrium quahogii TaxID=96639 RepID=A0A7S2WN85_9STRA|mmetsp:Transcript_19020/g.31121  ORF Transcript_19020/g.31121 Transcript_19020/m.31121 type:complete len:512 (-) Transcript_19020:201-1736(-)
MGETESQSEGRHANGVVGDETGSVNLSVVEFGAQGLEEETPAVEEDVEAGKKCDSSIAIVEGNKIRPINADNVLPMRNFYATVYSFNMFTVTDGAIRVIVLLHANALNFTPIAIALMFTLYELMGVFTNLFGGIAGTRWGLKCTLFTSLFLQLVGLGLLMAVGPLFGYEYSDMTSRDRLNLLIYITFCQALSGVSKDFMKLSCKSIPKLVTKEGQNGRLFKYVAWVTGMKNSLKGFGYIVGAVLVEVSSFEIAVGVLIGIILIIFPVPALYMDWGIGMGSRKDARFSMAVFKKPWNINVLSLARFFLFGSRDVWFEIAAPLFIRVVLAWPEFTVGLFMGGYIILYGNLQTFASALYKENNGGKNRFFKGPPTEKHVWTWSIASFVLLAVWGTGLFFSYRNLVSTNNRIASATVLLIGLFVYAFFFATNSAIHSYLIVLYAGKDKLTMDMGFYYMANAMGRLVGTILSGVIYQFTVEYFGLSMCMWVAAVFMLLAAISSRYLRPIENTLAKV